MVFTILLSKENLEKTHLLYKTALPNTTVYSLTSFIAHIASIYHIIPVLGVMNVGIIPRITFQSLATYTYPITFDISCSLFPAKINLTSGNY